MEQHSSSSKVTVEYHDPFNVYELLSPGLLARLPLRTLHWESHAGPLRAIKSLHVDLVPAKDTTFAPPARSTTDLSRIQSNDSKRAGDDGFITQALGKPSDIQSREDNKPAPDSTTIGTRHQIPGLRQTPYLKIFLLRCDDVETYKASARKEVKEWIKAHTPPKATSKKQAARENHDAFEHLILHVIVPNTAAAFQPRTTKSGSTTILDRLRSDFSGESKAVERVAQIRIGVNDVPYDKLPRVVPVIPGSNPYTESPQEHEASWADLLAKMKKLILDSFDMRVTQYEEDIREKEAQRALPGWNFCTFFVLKEGLARGFENVGLVEDSLVGYDELAVGLDAITREQAALGGGPAHGGSFLPYTEDLLKQIESSREKIHADIDAAGGGTEAALEVLNGVAGQEQDEILLSSDRKPYRELIMENKISVFEFKCYLFSRQLALLLRMGNAVSSREELLAKLQEARETALLGVAARRPPPQEKEEESENLSILSDICHRSVDFLASISRLMREDLRAAAVHSAWREEPKPEKDDVDVLDDPATGQAIDNIVSSFSFTISQQILAQTATRALPIPASNLAPFNAGLYADHEKATIPEPKTMMHPARSSSLTSQPPVGSTSPNVFPAGRRPSIQPSESLGSTTSTFLKAGLEDLAASRAQIYLLSRGVLERLGRQRDWLVEWKDANTIVSESPKMEDVDLVSVETIAEKENSSPSSKRMRPSLHGIDSKLLKTALQDKDDFYRLYEIITDKALRHFSVAGHVQSVQSAMGDLALLRFHLKDYASAASYLYRMTRHYGDTGWEDIQMPLLLIYMECLKELGRNDEYVKATMLLLSKYTARRMEEIEQKSRFKFGHIGPSSPLEDTSVEGYFTELMTVLPSLERDFPLALHSFFAHIDVAGAAEYHEKQDAFSLEFKLRYLLPDTMTVDKGKARLINVKEGGGRDIWLDMEEPCDLVEGVNNITFQSNVTIPGTYVLKSLILWSSRLVMSYDVDTEPPPISYNKAFVKCPQIILYQRANAFDIKLSASRHLHLAERKNLELSISSGWNNISHGELHLRSATAGLRVQTVEAKVVDGGLDITKMTEPGIIKLGALAPGESAKLFVPYTLEHDTNVVSVKLEASYVVGKETFFFARNFPVSVQLPLGVNVLDCFKQKTLFSKFSISSTTFSPLRLLASSLTGSDIYEAYDGGALSEPVVIFPRHEASLLYRTTRRAHPSVPAAGKKQRAALQLKLHYLPLEEEIDDALSSSLKTALGNSDVADYSRLVIPAVLSILHSRLSVHDLEHAAMLGELNTAPLLEEAWLMVFNRRYPSTAMRGLNTQMAAFVENTLRATPVIALPIVAVDEESIAKSRSIIIPVEVPTKTVVHSADLQLSTTEKNAVKCGDEDVAVLHQPISATLVLKHTRNWDSPTSAHRNKELTFTYELSAPADTWLIGGRRKGTFTIPPAGQKAETMKFPVMLIPLREGYLGYPILDIRAVPYVLKEGEKEPKKITSESEVEWKNAASVVRVSSLAGKTTVSLDAPGPNGGAYLMESERVVV